MLYNFNLYSSPFPTITWFYGLAGTKARKIHKRNNF